MSEPAWTVPLPQCDKLPEVPSFFASALTTSWLCLPQGLTVALPCRATIETARKGTQQSLGLKGR